MKVDSKKIEGILKGAKGYLLFTDQGYGMEGNTPTLLAIYTMITEQMMTLKGMDKEKLDLAYDLAFMSEKEKLQKMLDIVKDMLGEEK